MKTLKDTVTSINSNPSSINLGHLTPTRTLPNPYPNPTPNQVTSINSFAEQIETRNSRVDLNKVSTLVSKGIGTSKCSRAST